MNERRSARIKEYFYYHNFRLLFVLFTSRWFRYAFALSLTIAIGVPLSVIKIIPATKDGFKPEIHFSVLDWLQAEALAQTARKAVKANESAIAFAAFRSAIGNNPSKIEFNQDYLESLVTLDVKQDYWKDAIQTSFWLLRLSNTNRSDLELTTRAFESYHFDYFVLQSIDAYPGPKSVELDRAYLRSLFRTGQENSFRDQWNMAPPEVSNDPTMRLFHLAYEAAKGTEAEANQARSILEEAGKDPRSHLLSKQLQLHISHHQEDLSTFEKTFASLVEEFDDSISNHLLYWDLLKKSGKIDLARSHATEFILPPQTGFHVVEIADAYTSLGLPELALRYLKNYGGEFGFEAQSQFAQASLLIVEERWRELHRFALEIRAAESPSAAFMAFSYFIEGLAAIRQGRQRDAGVAFQNIRGYSMEESNLGLHVGSNLWDLGFPKEAYAALSPERKRYANHVAYWQLMLEVTKSDHSASQMLIAAENLFRLAPDHLPNQVNYASLLISNRTQLDRALALTFDAMLKAPDNIPIKVNYAQALATSGRPDEASQILGSIDPDRFDATQWQGFAFAWLTVYHQKQEYQAAQSIAEQVIPELLLPGDRKYFEVMVESVYQQSNLLEARMGDSG